MQDGFSALGWPNRVGSAKDSIWRALRHYDPSQLWFQLEEIVEQRTYLRHGIRVGEGDVVLDVGANVGVSAALFASECGAGVVHCFEPAAPLFELLRENVAPFPACVPIPTVWAQVPGAFRSPTSPRLPRCRGCSPTPRRTAPWSARR